MLLCCGDAWLQVLCDSPLFPSSGVSSLFDVMVSDAGPFFVVGRSVGSCFHFVPSGQGGFVQLMSFTYYLTCVATWWSQSAWCPDVRVCFSSFSNAPAASRHAMTFELSFIILFFSLCFSLHGCCLSGSAWAFGVSH